MKELTVLMTCLAMMSGFAWAEEKKPDSPSAAPKLERATGDLAEIDVSDIVKNQPAKKLVERKVTPATKDDLLPQKLESKDAGSRVRELENIKSGNDSRTKLPDRAGTDAAGGTGLEGHGKIGSEDKKVHDLVREALGLGGDGLDSGKIGRTDKAPDPARYGTGSAQDKKGAPSDPGFSAGAAGRLNRTEYYKDQQGDTRVSHARYENSDGTGYEISVTSTPNDSGGQTHVESHRVVDSNGDTVYESVESTVTDSNGRVIDGHKTETAKELSRQQREEVNETFNELVARLNRERGQDAPDDNATGDQGPCNPVSGFGCEKRKSAYIDKVAQPVHGDEVSGLGGTGGRPNAGPSSVTNPGTHDGSAGSGKNGGRTKPGEGAIDPEEIVPRPSGVTD